MSSDGCSPPRWLTVADCPIITGNFDFIRQGCPLHNGVKSPAAFGRSRSGSDSKGFNIIGHRESLLS